LLTIVVNYSIIILNKYLNFQDIVIHGWRSGIYEVFVRYRIQCILHEMCRFQHQYLAVNSWEYAKYVSVTCWLATECCALNKMKKPNKIEVQSNENLIGREWEWISRQTVLKYAISRWSIQNAVTLFFANCNSTGLQKKGSLFRVVSTARFW